jgi:hypothetical protein
METWINPLEARLPIAPDMRIYCLFINWLEPFLIRFLVGTGLESPQSEATGASTRLLLKLTLQVHRGLFRGGVGGRHCGGYFLQLREQYGTETPRFSLESGINGPFSSAFG